MRIVQKKCPSCGGKIEINTLFKEGICPFCGVGYYLDDEIIEVKHSGTIEVKDDYDYEIAMTTLYKFFEYDKSLIMLKNLLNRYAHKKEIYISLIIALTHNFTINEINIFVLNQVNEYYFKYSSLAEKDELSLYDSKILKLNALYWLKQVINLTDNFNKVKNVDVSTLKHNWNNFLKYADDDLRDEYLNQYNLYKGKLINKLNDDKKSAGFFFISLFISLVCFLICYCCYYNFDKAEVKTKDVKYSTVVDYTISNMKESVLLDILFKDTKYLSIDSFFVDMENKIFTVSVILDNPLKYAVEDFSFNMIDDRGPVIELLSCNFEDTKIVDISKCVRVIDLTDGVISNDSIVFDTTACNFTKPSYCQATVTAYDSDNQRTSKIFDLSVITTELDVKFNVADTSLNTGDTTTFSYSISPNVLNKKYSLTYDENIIKVENNKITALAKGETDLCFRPEYDTYYTKCVTINVSIKCKNSYSFKFSGGKNEKIVAGENFCPGTYKFSAKVLNNDNVYYVTYYPDKQTYSGDLFRIWKNYDSLNEEGSKIAFVDGSYLNIDSGITEIKLYK